MLNSSYFFFTCNLWLHDLITYNYFGHLEYLTLDTLNIWLFAFPKGCSQESYHCIHSSTRRLFKNHQSCKSKGSRNREKVSVQKFSHELSCKMKKWHWSALDVSNPKGNLIVRESSYYEVKRAWTNAVCCPSKRWPDSLNIWFAFSAGLSPGSSHDTSFASRPSSGEGTSAHLAPFSTKRLDREFERKLQEVFVSVQLEKVCCKIGKHLL